MKCTFLKRVQYLILKILYQYKVHCGDEPPAGINSAVQSSTGTTYQSTVTYVCNTGYTTAANMTLTCQANGQWSGNQGPNCTGKS